MIHKVKPTAMKISTKIPFIIAFVLMTGSSSSLKAQGPNFLDAISKLIGTSVSKQLVQLMSGKILIHSKVHNGQDYSIVLNLSLESKIVMPNQCFCLLHGYDKFSTGVRTVLAQRSLNKYDNGMSMSKNEVYEALKRIRTIYPAEVKQITFPLPLGGRIKNDAAKHPSLLASM
jgi:hypothetical protein